MSRFGHLMVTYFVVLVTGIFSLFHHRPRVMWNASASTPVGLYALHRPGELKVGDLVADQPPLALARFMAGRHYLPLNVPLLKYVGAITGQTVCRQGPT
jgi:type IV secretory pathway protease TraF